MCRLESCYDLVAEEAKYHPTCIAKFHLKEDTDRKKGRPEHVEMSRRFEKVCVWLEEESDCELYTLQEIQSKMEELNKPEKVYSKDRLKQRLKERYKDHLYFTKLQGRADIICFKDMANFIMYRLKKRPSQTKEEILKTAAQLIKADIRVSAVKRNISIHQ